MEQTELREYSVRHAEDIRAARAALAEPGPNSPLADVLAEYADDLSENRMPTPV